MYIKDSIIEAQIEKDLKKQHLKGRIEEIEHQLRGKKRNSGLRKIEKIKRRIGYPRGIIFQDNLFVIPYATIRSYTD